MTTYKQNVPEMIYVSPAIYLETLAVLDPFQKHGQHMPLFARETGYTGKLIEMLIESAERIGTEPELEMLRR